MIIGGNRVVFHTQVWKYPFHTYMDMDRVLVWIIVLQYSLM